MSPVLLQHRNHLCLDLKNLCSVSWSNPVNAFSLTLSTCPFPVRKELGGRVKGFTSLAPFFSLSTMRHQKVLRLTADSPLDCSSSQVSCAGSPTSPFKSCFIQGSVSTRRINVQHLLQVISYFSLLKRSLLISFHFLTLQPSLSATSSEPLVFSIVDVRGWPCFWGSKFACQGKFPFQLHLHAESYLTVSGSWVTRDIKPSWWGALGTNFFPARK